MRWHQYVAEPKRREYNPPEVSGSSNMDESQPVLTAEDAVVLIAHLPDKHHPIAVKLLKLYWERVVLSAEDVVVLIAHLPDKHHSIAVRLLKLHAELVNYGTPVA